MRYHVHVTELIGEWGQLRRGIHLSTYLQETWWGPLHMERTRGVGPPPPTEWNYKQLKRPNSTISSPPRAVSGVKLFKFKITVQRVSIPFVQWRVSCSSLAHGFVKVVELGQAIAYIGRPPLPPMEIANHSSRYTLAFSSYSDRPISLIRFLYDAWVE